MITFIESTETPKYANGVYMCKQLSEATSKEIKRIQNELLKEFKDIKIEDDLHCTLIYSPAPCYSEPKLDQSKMVAKFKKYSMFGPELNVLVMEIRSEELLERNKHLKAKYNFTSTYGEYRPHITIASNVPDIALCSLKPFNFEVELIKEKVEDLDD